MKQMRKMSLMSAAVVITGLVLLMNFYSSAQDKPKRDEFQAQAFGEGTQLGQTFNVTVIIDDYSPPEDRQALIGVFERAGQKGLVNALGKMRAKGHIAITGTLGYDVSYIQSFPNAGGRKIRLVTNRPIRVGEAWEDGPSMDYNLSVLELNISDTKNKSAGTLIPACQFTINKGKELDVETYQNPWRLVDVIDWK
jgi:hypothetical protein